MTKLYPYSIQYIDDVTKETKDIKIDAENESDAAIRLADQLGYAPIILVLGMDYNYTLMKIAEREFEMIEKKFPKAISAQQIQDVLSLVNPLLHRFDEQVGVHTEESLNFRGKLVSRYNVMCREAVEIIMCDGERLESETKTEAISQEDKINKILEMERTIREKRLAHIRSEYQELIKQPHSQNRAMKLGNLMSAMEAAFGVRNNFMTRDPKWEKENADIRELYEAISDSRNIW